jgi:hypothetical protein
MKCIEKIAVGFAVGLALNASLSAAEVVSPNNPYAPIVVRNVFGLNPLQPVDPNQNSEPPAKITPNGIMTIFGNRQVLFKVSVPAQPGIPAKEDDYILGEGQRQDDIEVTRIDEKSGVVTFNNHGVVQEIPLTVATASAMPVAATQNPTPGFLYGNNGRHFGGGGRFGRNSGVESGGNNFNGANNGSGYGANNGSNVGHATVQNPLADQVSPDLTPETQIIMIEANRIATQSQVDNGEMPPLPITEMTPPP